MREQPFHFGIYAGSVSGTPSGLAIGPADDMQFVGEALDDLQQGGPPILVRAYLHYRGAADWGSGDDLYSQQFRTTLRSNRKLDLVLCFHDSTGDVPGWLHCIEQTIDAYGPDLGRLQITEEANLSFGTGAIDGDYPNVIPALASGVVSAKREFQRRGLPVQVGFSAAPGFGPAAEFWTRLRDVAEPEFVESVDYAGLDFFPDVFRPVAPQGSPNDLRSSVVFLLQHFRHQMTIASLSQKKPIVITENGWPTGSARPESCQTEVLDTIVKTVHAYREQLNIRGYQWFALRDADSVRDDLFHQFGLLRSDYSRKSGFYKFKELIGELSSVD